METYAQSIIAVVVITTLLMLSLAGFVLAMFFLQQRKQILHANRLCQIQNEHERELLRTQLAIQESTFENISQEIHDNIGLCLTLAKLNLNTLDISRPFEHPVMVQSSKDLISKAIEDLNDISKSLKGDKVTSLGLLKSIELEIGKVEKTNLYDVNFQVVGEPFYMEPEKEICLYRIFQESINNILKHASARCIEITLLFTDKHFCMSVIDNGIGFDYSEYETTVGTRVRAGIGNIKNRAKLIFAECQIKSERNKGTTIYINLPKST
ncbi:MAG: hypothetical protein EOP48_23160 [Sphingobacteriales bacterium]|nr:MAG: hypothetical protein EOP48_23160 [Sphingobacteriales bacterium]